LLSGYHIYIVDLPGYGRSTNLNTFRGFAKWTDDLYAFTRELRINKFIYVGYSMTGLVGYQLALEHPEALKALIPIVSVPVSSVPLPDREEQQALESGTIEDYRAITQKALLFPVPTSDKKRLIRREQALQRGWQKTEATDREALAYMQDQILRTKEGREKMFLRLNEIKVPTLLLFGGQDWSNPITQAIISAMSIPGAKAVFFQDYGHGLTIEGPERLANEITLFVNELNNAE
jgi:pimeloyl-ACP methyl ester carboxylesterase